MPTVLEPRGFELIIRIHLMLYVLVLDIIQKRSMIENQIREYRRSRLEHQEGFVQFLEDLFKSIYRESPLELASRWMQASDTGPGFIGGQTLYFNLKRFLQQNIFKGDPTDQCKKIYIKMKTKYEKYQKMLEKEKNEDIQHKLHLKMMKYAYKCTSCLCVALDAEITLCPTSFDWDEHVVHDTRLQRLLNELYGFIDKTPNQQIVEVALFSRIAIAYAMAGNLVKAEDYIKKAFLTSFGIPNCSEREFMFHMYTMILLFKYQDDPTEHLLETSLSIVERGLQSIQDETEEPKRIFWMRMILLRKVFLLLGLGNKMEVINGWGYKEEHVKNAEELLVKIEKMPEMMEKRREMFFYMAKARISELQNHLKLAIDNVQDAIDCDELGCYGETKYAQNYKEVLENKLEEEQRLTLRHTVDGPNSQECTTPVYSTGHSEITIYKRIE